jgi:hypothetical protein
VDGRSLCDVYNNVSQARAREILDIPFYKGWLDRARVKLEKSPINYPQPAQAQKEAIEKYEAYRQSKGKGKGRGGRGRGAGRSGRGANSHVAEPAPAEAARDMLELQKELGLKMHSAEPNDAAVQENAEALDAGLARLQAVFPSVEGEEQDDYMSVDQDLESLLESCDCTDLIPTFSVADIDTCEAAASYSPEEMQVQIPAEHWHRGRRFVPENDNRQCKGDDPS